MSVGMVLQTGITLALLLAAVTSDLRSRKVPNTLVVTGLVAGLAFMLFHQGLSGLMTSTLSFLTATAAVLPLYFLRAIGGGDVKLFMAISVLLTWQQVLISLLGSLIWGSIFGLIQVFLKGEGKAFAHNMMALAHRAKIPDQKTHKVPFTIALLLGYLTSLVWTGGL